MKVAAAILVVLSLVGCATPDPYIRPSYETTSSQAEQRALLQTDAQALRSNLYKRRAELKVAKLQSEIDQLKDEIAALEIRLADVERKIAASESAVPSAATGYTGSGAVHTGPRGGRYTIGPSGNKNYIRRK